MIAKQEQIKNDCVRKVTLKLEIIEQNENDDGMIFMITMICRLARRSGLNILALRFGPGFESLLGLGRVVRVFCLNFILERFDDGTVPTY